MCEDKYFILPVSVWQDELYVGALSLGKKQKQEKYHSFKVKFNSLLIWLEDKLIYAVLRAVMLQKNLLKGALHQFYTWRLVYSS